jgi:hypothetical protein
MGDIIKFPGKKKGESEDHPLSPVELLKYCVTFTYENGGMEEEDFDLMCDVFDLVDATLEDK